jgi:hypothetical protein
MGDEISNPLIYLIYQRLNLTISQAAYPLCERRIPIPHETDLHPEGVSLWMEDFRELVEIAISKIGDTKHKLQSRAGRDRFTSLYEMKKNKYFYRSLNEQVYYYLDGLFAIHESNENVDKAKHETRHNGAIIDDFLNKEKFNWTALKRMAQSVGMYSDSPYSKGNLDKALLGGMEHWDFDFNSINRTTTLIESLYILCDIPFNADNSNEHPKCVMEKVEVLNEAIMASLFFNWDGYFSSKNELCISFVNDTIKEYIADHYSANKFFLLKDEQYICNFSASNNKEHLVLLKDIQTKLFSKPSSQKEIRIMFTLFISSEISRLKSEQNGDMDSSLLPFIPNLDYSEIIKKGKKYILNTGQSAVIKYIAEKFLAGVSAVPKIEIVKAIRNAEITTDIMRDTFRGNTPARNALLKVGATAGTLSLRF